ncbi:GNAT family N-acetyltransferase [Clostridium swellfunianum]|uniref:GNAT family N-acetyltransferase n=1 Tax=Clostridium swellfunianum TaxID=1367462 RepID=UPI00202F3D6D|nr:GNAT family N-acetyltransferase [Clostridium swellfunianum]MCM0650265.1 GNAT family N-acetyltransferase [Clostridium swellfunianum]
MNIFETNRLIIRCWELEDYRDMYELNSDEKVNPSAGCSVIKDIEKIKANLKLFISRNLSFAIVLKEENKVIGTIGMDENAPDEALKELKQRYIGYRLNSNYWGKGYATEAVQYFIRYLFENLDLDLIWSSHFDFNEKSKRVIEKCGFKYKFSRNKIVQALGDKTVTELFYSLDKSVYLSEKSI